MRNLNLLTVREVEGLDELKSVHFFTVDYDTGYIVCVNTTYIIILDSTHKSVVSSVSLAEHGYKEVDVVGVEHLPDQQAVCVALSDGNIILCTPDQHQVECIGSVDGKLTSMKWSPDQEIVVFTTGRDTLLLMTREFEPFLETDIHQNTFGEAAFVQVGWGKKETQFHGSIGKEAATVKREEGAPVLPWDDLRPRVSWRGDALMFVVSSVSPQTGCRELRVWAKDGTLISTSETITGLEQALAWKPSGSLIACTRTSPNKHEVIFYEKNGLRHTEFTLPFQKETVKVHELVWNTESTVLAVWCEDLPSNKDYLPSSYVQLWTVNNYHWYQKQTLNFKSTNEGRVIGLMWDLEHAYRLHVMTSLGKYLQYTWSWVTSHSWGQTTSDQANVAVIDGDKVLLTPLRKMVVPPPMSAFTIQLPSPANQVVFAPPPFTNDMAVFLADRTLAIYRFPEGNREVSQSVSVYGAGGQGFHINCDLPKLEAIARLSSLPDVCSDFPQSLNHLSWVTPDAFVIFGASKKGNNSVLLLAEIKMSDKPELTISSHIEVEGEVYNTACSQDGGSLAIQLTDGTLLKYDPMSGVILPWESSSGNEVKFPQPCHQMCVSELGGEEVVLGLTERFRFYVNEIQVCSNCTSFIVHDEYLLLTTLSHTCRCINRNTALKDLPLLSDGKSHPFDESVRRVERGSRIVLAVPEDTKLVLQMPRGNLETIHPRALVLSAVRLALDRLEFKAAFSLMKKHRINLNLIYDHNPQSFMTHVEKCLSQIHSVTDINIFLTELREEDVTMTMYTAAYQKRFDQSDSSRNNVSKVNVVCDIVRECLSKMDENKYLLSILTTYVKKTNPELQEALEMVRELKNKPITEGGITAEEALKYLLFLVDVNELYDIALGTYDFDLVMMVAEKSQKDPKEYVPFLNNLRQLEESYQRYTIDKQLRRYEKALHHIVKCEGRFPELLSLVKDHQLYRSALNLFPPTSQQYKDIAVSFGEFLAEKRCHEEAGLLYVKAEEWSMALESFQKSHNWRQTLCMAAMLDYSAEDLVKLSRKLADSLRDRQDFLSSAIVFEQYAQDVEEAIVTLIEGHLWEEALRLMYKYKRTDFIETNLKPALMETYNQQLLELEGIQTEFLRHKKRLFVVHEEKEKARIEFMERGDNYNDGDADLFSDTSSATGESVKSSVSQRSTINSRSTGRSSRNRRKLERKKWSLKEGSAHEDLALIEALSKLITQVEGLREEVTSLMKTLVQFFHDQEASEIQTKYDELFKLMEKSLPEIWNSESEDSSTRPSFGPDATANSIAEAMQSGKPSKNPTGIDPVLKVPPKLTVDKKWKLKMFDS